jgi:hypothetical protein
MATFFFSALQLEYLGNGRLYMARDWNIQAVSWPQQGIKTAKAARLPPWPAAYQTGRV